MDRIKDKVALITGASQGIGEGIARLFVAEGAHVVLTDINHERGESLARELGERTHYMPLDVSQESQWEEVLKNIQDRFGRLDILVNNAGIMGTGPEFGPQDPEHASLHSWRCIHSVNLDGVFLGCKYAIAAMQGQGGAIINMSSRSGVVGIPHSAAYASSKAAIKNHTKTVALYCAEQGYNIRCNSVLPAAILTPLWDPLLGGTPEARLSAIEKLGTTIPLGHMGEPLDVAYGVLYLASDEAKYVTGTELIIDGGILAGSAAAPQKK